ncbi:ABC transporter permease [Cytophagaceae bacterium ABcell3]|nr:ABC transporter permease [Cytophagaceae bacterium ABcell3]
MKDYQSFLPKHISQFLESAGALTRFTGKFFKEAFTPPHEWKEIFKQCYNLGVKSLSLVGISAFIIGMVLTIQAKPTMAEFGAVSFIPAMVSLSIIREIGPVLTALICAGKIGSGIGAELGSMKVTEQLDAMAVSGTRAFNYTVVTRVTATTFMIPVLVFYADIIGLMGSWFGMNIDSSMSLRLFLRQALGAVLFIDIVSATVKSFFFGLAIGIVGCYKGYNATKGTVGVGKAANSAVVVASLLVFILDMIAVQITQLFM